MRASILIAAAAALILAAAPAIAQTREQEARESTGMSNFQKQHGGEMRDRQINSMIFHREHHRMHYSHASR